MGNLSEVGLLLKRVHEYQYILLFPDNLLSGEEDEELVPGTGLFKKNRDDSY